MKTVCKTNMCTGCFACENICPKKAISVVDDIATYNAYIDVNKCIDCGMCERVCHNINMPDIRDPIYWKQGWSDEKTRREASSGGAASAIIKTFIEMGGYVSSCVFKDAEFKFIVTRKTGAEMLFAGSKYVKSNPSTVFDEIRKLIKNGERVLFIGLPCQSAAIQNYLHYHDNLTTIDLICHGTPSPVLLKKYLEESGVGLNKIQDIKFRVDNEFSIFTNGKPVVARGVMDSYTMAFLKGLDYTENCYKCHYAKRARVSDITLGDAWGQLSDTEKKGVSLILCQTQKGIDLVKSAHLILKEVDLEKAIGANQQLRKPSSPHPRREFFFNRIKKGKSFRTTVFLIFKKECIKQNIKTCMVKLHLK